MVIYFQGPNSYTGEDVVELMTHGSVAVVNDLLASLHSLSSLRLARAGEFSRRAFSNDKMDVSQVEWLAELAASATSIERRAAIYRQQQAPLALERWRHLLLRSSMLINAFIDFDDDDIVDNNDNDNDSDDNLRRMRERVAAIRLPLETARDDMRAALSTDARRHLRPSRVAPRVVLVGAPNVGKSSLMNYMTSQQSSIVSNQAGTTRDVVRAIALVDQLELELLDTAGLREQETEDEIEREGQRRSIESAKSADLIVYVCDEDVHVDVIRRAHVYDEARLIVVRNKIDLSTPSEAWLTNVRSKFHNDVVCCSATTHENLSQLVDAIVVNSNGGGSTADNDARLSLFAQHRQQSLLKRCLERLEYALELLVDDAYDTVDLAAEEVRLAAELLDEVSRGPSQRHDIEPVLEEIFAHFCVGK